MKGLVISIEKDTDFKLLQSLLKKMGLRSKAINEDEVLDFGLSLAMKEVDKTKTVSREKVIKKLT